MVNMDSITYRITAKPSVARAANSSFILVALGGNVMLVKDSMTLKVLDFGMARKLRQGLDFNHGALKNDILNAIRLFCGLYIGQDFGNNFVLEKEIAKGTLRKVGAWIFFMPVKSLTEIIMHFHATHLSHLFHLPVTASSFPLPIHLFICLSICLSVRPSTHPRIHLPHGVVP